MPVAEWAFWSDLGRLARSCAARQAVLNLRKRESHILLLHESVLARIVLLIVSYSPQRRIA
jgi:hypothetical protein